MNWKQALIAISLSGFTVSLSQVAKGEGGERGGGDTVALEFTSFGGIAVKQLESWGPNAIPGIDLQRLKSAIETTPVMSASNPIFDSAGDQKDAVTDLRAARVHIEIYRPSWLEKDGNYAWKLSIALHEYLRVIGARDDKYEISSQFMQKLTGISDMAKWYSGIVSYFCAELAHTEDLKNAELDERNDPNLTRVILLGNYLTMNSQTEVDTGKATPDSNLLAKGMVAYDIDTRVWAGDGNSTLRIDAAMRTGSERGTLAIVATDEDGNEFSVKQMKCLRARSY